MRTAQGNETRFAPPDAQFIALITLLTVMAISMIYPETFIYPKLTIAGVAVSPLGWLTPILAIVTAACVYSQRKELSPGWPEFILLIFYSYVFARSLVSGYDIPGAGKYIVYGAGVYLLTAIALKDNRFRMFFLWVLAVIALLIIVYGFIEFLFQSNIIFQEYMGTVVTDPPKGIHRIGSALAHPVVFGSVLVQLFPFFVLFWAESKTKRNQIFGIFMIVVSLIAVLLSFSKGSWLAISVIFLAGLATLLVRRSDKLLKMAAGIAALIAISLMVFWRQVYNEIVWRADFSVNVRLRTWREALRLIGERPLLGYGFRRGAIELQNTAAGQHYLEISSRPIPVDNGYIWVMLDHGLIGLVLWVAFIVSVIATGINRLIVERREDYWTVAALASMATGMITAITFDAWSVWPTFLLFIVATAIVVSSAGSSDSYAEECAKF